jgi:hypothetical protein
MMMQSLDLTGEQAEKFEPIFKEQQAKISALRRDNTLSRRDRMLRLQELHAQADSNITKVITPEQALVGFSGIGSPPITFGEWLDFGDTLGFFFSGWMSGQPLKELVLAAQQPYLGGPSGGVHLQLPFAGSSPAGHPELRGKMEIHGYEYIRKGVDP